MKQISKFKLRKFNTTPNVREYEAFVSDLLDDKQVRSMRGFIQHGDTNTLEHSISVSYLSYRICKKLGWDFRSAARGGLLHDFFLYDWHGGKDYKGFHGFHHPRIAMENAEKSFLLNSREKDIIRKHMWPLTLRLPRYRESFVVLLIDKFCSIVEVMAWRQKAMTRIKVLLRD